MCARRSHSSTHSSRFVVRIDRRWSVRVRFVRDFEPIARDASRRAPKHPASPNERTICTRNSSIASIARAGAATAPRARIRQNFGSSVPRRAHRARVRAFDRPHESRRRAPRVQARPSARLDAMTSRASSPRRARSDAAPVGFSSPAFGIRYAGLPPRRRSLGFMGIFQSHGAHAHTIRVASATTRAPCAHPVHSTRYTLSRSTPHTDRGAHAVPYALDVWHTLSSRHP